MLMEVKGTAHYMSPEHFFDFRKADQRADIYSLGKIIFEAVTGKIGNGAMPFKTVALPKADTPLTVNPFYMDENQVTNHQYVEFLNHHLSQLEVERGVVRMDDEIWLMLGEIYEGYEPIEFKDGEFKVTNAIYTSFPVLRVTAYGAAAYARFYSRRPFPLSLPGFDGARNGLARTSRRPDLMNACIMALMKYPRTKAHPDFQKKPAAVLAASLNEDQNSIDNKMSIPNFFFSNRPL